MPPSLRPVLPQRATADAGQIKESVARHRALFGNFFHRELFSRYLGSVSGLAWAFVHPLALLAVYHFVFTTVFRAGPMDGKSFLLFVAVALWPWLAAQEALQRGTVSIASYAGLIRKVAFPHELVVYASVAATLALQFAGYLVVLVVLRAVRRARAFRRACCSRCRCGSCWPSPSPVSRSRSRRCRCSSGTSSTC